MSAPDFRDPPPRPERVHDQVTHETRAMRLRAKRELLEEAAMRYAWQPSNESRRELQEAALDLWRVAKEKPRTKRDYQEARNRRNRAGRMGS